MLAAKGLVTVTVATAPLVVLAVAAAAGGGTVLLDAAHAAAVGLLADAARVGVDPHSCSSTVCDLVPLLHVSQAVAQISCDCKT